MEGFIGEIRLFGGSFAPRYWTWCDGRLLSIVEYQALFTILGTTYGGDGTSNFALPDLIGAVVVGAGTSTPGTAGTAGGAGGGVSTLAMNYIICIEGLFPSRDY